MPTEAIRIEGLREFRAGLKAIGDGSEKKLRTTLNEAGEIVIDHTRPWIPRRTGRTAGSLKLASTQTQARVKGGGSRAPWYPWLDFGGSVGPGKSVYRKFYREGRYAWRTLGKQRPAIVEALNGALVQLVHDAGLEVTSG